jgi:D-alanine transaminase
MNELIWLNGEVIPMSEARIGVEDRGYQFADGVYEVIRLYDGRTFTLREHLERLERSAADIRIKLPMPRTQLTAEIEKFLPRGGVKDGMIYLQLTRGCSARNHVIPHPPCKPTLLFYVRPLPPVPAPGTGYGVKLLSVPDERWSRCWIKSIALLPNVLAKNEAIDKGCDEAVFVQDGMVSECSASNFFAVANGKVLTHPVGPKVLPGITRAVLLELAKGLDIPVVERPVSEAEALAADEVFITSTTREISWVSEWNGRKVGSGVCGPVTLKLHNAVQERVKRETVAR